MSKGIVVDHKESHVRYAVSAQNFNPKVHKKVRDLAPGETVVGFKPLRKGSLGSAASPTPTPGAENDAAETLGAPRETQDETTNTHKTEGSSSEGTKDANK